MRVEADRRSGRVRGDAYRASTSALHRAAGGQDSTVTTAPAAAAATTVTVSGKVTYKYRDGSIPSRPRREGAAPEHHRGRGSLGRTATDGTYTLTGALPVAGLSYVVRALADVPSALVLTGSMASYFADTSSKKPNSGTSWTGANLDLSTLSDADTVNAFALLDAAYTVGTTTCRRSDPGGTHDCSSATRMARTPARPPEATMSSTFRGAIPAAAPTGVLKTPTTGTCWLTVGTRGGLPGRDRLLSGRWA